MKKITGLRKACRDYREANKDGYYSPRYGRMMLDIEKGELWTDEFYSLGHNSWKEYHDKSIVSVDGWNTYIYNRYNIEFEIGKEKDTKELALKIIEMIENGEDMENY